MPKVSDEHRQAQRRRIHEAALSVYQAKGFAGATMTDIIEASGLSAGAIYGYYSGKADLQSAVIKEILADRRDLIDQAARQDPIPAPATVLAELTSRIPHEMLQAGLLLQVWGDIARPEVAQLSRAGIEGLRESWLGYLTAWLLDQGEPRRRARQRAQLLTPVVVGLAQGYLVQATVLGREGVDTYFDGVHELFAGLGPSAG